MKQRECILPAAALALAIALLAGRVLGQGDKPTAGDSAPGKRPLVGDERSGDQPPTPRTEEDRDGGRDRDRDRSQRDHRRPYSAPELTDEQIELRLTIVEAYYPELFERLKQAREHDPKQLRDALGRMGPHLDYLVREKERDPEGFVLRAKQARVQTQIFAAARRLRSAEGDDRAKVTAELRELVGQQHDLRLEEAARDITRLEQRIAELRKEIEQHKTDRDKLIDERVQQLVERVERFGGDGDRTRRPDGFGPPTGPGSGVGPRGERRPDDRPPPPPPPAEEEPR